VLFLYLAISGKRKVSNKESCVNSRSHKKPKNKVNVDVIINKPAKILWILMYLFFDIKLLILRKEYYYTQQQNSNK